MSAAAEAQSGAVRGAVLAGAICLPLIAGAAWLWAERGWLIVVDLSTISAHALCL